MRSMRVYGAALVMVAVAARGAAASAQTTAPWGRVLRVEDDLVVLDLTSQQITPGQRVRLMRPIEVRHPITRAVLRDRYALGAVTMHSVGAQLSVARLSEALLRAPEVGDEVEAIDGAPRPPLRAQPVLPPPPPQAPSRPQAPSLPSTTPPVARPQPPPQASAPELPPPPPRVDLEDAAVLAAWHDTLRAVPSVRVARWERFLREHSSSRYVLSAQAALTQLRGDHASAESAPSRTASTGPLGLTSGIPDLMLGDPARFAMQVNTERVRARGTLYVRRPGAVPYVSVPLVAQGDRFVIGVVPERFVTLEGFEYFVGLVGVDHEEVSVMGTAQRPRRVTVSRRAEDEPARTGRTRIDLRGEYADVGSRTVNAPSGPRFRAQRFYLVEGDFFQRLELPALYGYRVGFGVYEGEGVALSAVDSDAASTSSTVIYGYHELEFGISRMVHLIARGAIGVHGDGIVGGAQLRLRIGEELKTNLILGGDIFNQIGQRAFFALNLDVHRRVPLLVQGEVFNQSFSGGDPMFRFIAQAGVRVTRWFTVAARGSYQLRNIQNGGFGGGLSTTFDW